MINTKPSLQLKFIALLLIFCYSCSEPGFQYKIDTTVNPHNIAPLTARLNISVNQPCYLTVKVLGDIPIEQDYEIVSDSLEIPILGLYPQKLNDVVITLNHEGGQIVDTLKLQTANVPDVFPVIEINKLERQQMETGMHACDIHFANNGVFRSMPMIFDDKGNIRWYLDLSFHGKMVSPFQRLKDGTILMVGRQTIYEFDMLGKLLKQTKIDNNYGMHHDVLELPNGDLLICVGKRDAYIELNGDQVLSDSDFMILLDRKNYTIKKEWDLAKHLDVSRNELNIFRPGDWLHMNGLAFDERDSTIVISAKHQGIIKISWDDQLKWIMAPRKGWEKSGRNGQGFETEPFLLKAIDTKGKAFSNTIQDGKENAINFDFPWGPHAPKLLANGNLLLFDNGAFRNFSKDLTYSKAVEFKIDEQNGTVEQIWQYGKERGEAFFSSIVSDVDLLPNTGNVLITSGYIFPSTNHSGKIVEVNKATGEVAFEATLYFKTLYGNKTVAGWGQTDILYRSERMELKY